jgi:ATP-dependent DNA ligase
MLIISSQLKKDYLAGVGDSLDLVVVGGYYGKGKRTNVYGAFLLACYDADSEEFQTICKIGTGFSEEVLQSHYETLKPLEVVNLRGDIKAGGAKPDVWFEPQIVWEVLTADLSLSPIYTAAQGLVSLSAITSLQYSSIITEGRRKRHLTKISSLHTHPRRQRCRRCNWTRSSRSDAMISTSDTNRSPDCGNVPASGFSFRRRKEK